VSRSRTKRANQRRVDPARRKAERLRMLQRVGKGLLLLLMIVSTAVAGRWLIQRWSVTHWTIRADAPIKAAIEAQLQAMPVRDFLSTRPDLLRKQWLARIPDMADVQVTRILPDRLEIQAVSRVAVALWQDEQSRLHLFDRHGVAYRLLRRGESPDLPLLRMTKEQLADAGRMLEVLARQDRRLISALSEIRAGSGCWHLYFSRGVSWLIPQADAGAAIDRVLSFLKQPRWQGGRWRVDARGASRWFVRPARIGGVI